MNAILIEPTPCGSVGIVFTLRAEGPKILRILLSQPALPAESLAALRYPDAKAASCLEVNATMKDLHRFFSGEEVNFSLDLIDLAQCLPFQKRVLHTVAAIPRGRLSSYGLIAAQLGVRHGARAVGRALNGNPFPLIIPCHRVIRSDRTLGGFQGGQEMKQRLLEQEGATLEIRRRK